VASFRVSRTCSKAAAHAQASKSVKSDTTHTQQQAQKRKSAVAPQTEFEPEYQGGMAAMYKFLTANIRLKKSDMIANKYFVGGRYVVYVGFTVTEKGEIKDVIVKKSVKNLPELDNEAVRVVQLMNGNWIAGKHNNQAVDTLYTLPVAFHFD
jgi:cell division septation protein DedD